MSKGGAWKEGAELEDSAFQLLQDGWAVFDQQTAGREFWEEWVPEHECGVETCTVIFFSESSLLIIFISR